MGGFLSPVRVALLLLCLAWAPASPAVSWLHRGGQGVPAASLETFAGEYTDPSEPDTPLSFYVQNGKLVMESERNVPAELKQTSPTHFSVPDTRITVQFIVDDSGRPESVTTSDDPLAVYRRSG